MRRNSGDFELLDFWDILLRIWQWCATMMNTVSSTCLKNIRHMLAIRKTVWDHPHVKIYIYIYIYMCVYICIYIYIIYYSHSYTHVHNGACKRFDINKMTLIKSIMPRAHFRNYSSFILPNVDCTWFESCIGSTFHSYLLRNCSPMGLFLNM